MKKALVLLPLLALGAGVRSADAGGPVGGHIGVAVSLVGMSGTSNGLYRTSTIGDGTTHAVFPLGVTLRKSKRLAVDFEMVLSAPQVKGDVVGLTIDPGVIYKYENFSTGVRVSMDIGRTANYGLVPLIHKAWKLAPRVRYFLEGDLPIVYDVNARSTAINVLLHGGLSF